MAKEQKGFIVYGDTKALADELTDEQLGQLFRGMLNYFAEGKMPKFTGVLKFAFIPIKQQMDRDKEKYDSKCEKNREKIQKYWDRVKKDTVEYSGIQMNTNATNTKTNTDTNTKTDTDTTTTTKTDTKSRGGGRDGGDDYDIWSKLTPSDIDTIYDSYPDSGGFLIEEVAAEVRTKRKKVKNAVSFILGYAKNVGWDDKADHFDGGGMA